MAIKSQRKCQCNHIGYDDGEKAKLVRNTIANVKKPFRSTCVTPIQLFIRVN